MIRILLSTRLGERRMTQSDLARVTGIRSQTINELYHDFAERVNLDDLDLICEALDCDLEDLIVREPNIERRVKEVRHIPQTVSKSRKKYPPHLLPGCTLCVRAFFIFIIAQLDGLPIRHDDCNLAAAQFCCLDKVIRRPAVHAHLVAHCLLAAHTEDFSQICLLLPCHGKQPLDDVRHCHVFIHSFHV